MLITELEGDTAVVIDIVQGKDKLTFETKVVSAISNGVLLESLKYKDRVLNVSFKGLVIFLTANLEPLPFRFSEVQLETVQYKGEIYHLAKTVHEGKPVNRRENFRVYIGEDGMAQINEHKKDREVLVKDVSISGFAIVAKDDLEADDAKVRLTYSDKDSRIILHGNVVRKEIIDESKILYGCKLEETPQGLAKYLNQKQTDKNKLN